MAITLDGDTATAAGDGVSVDGSTVTITAAGTYRISGTLDDGQIVVESSEDGIVRLVLDGVEVTSSTSAALGVTDADEVMIVLADASTNTLTDADRELPDESATGDAADVPDAALFSMADLTITGDGALTVTGNAEDGIASKDGLVITGGSITVTAVDDAIRGKDYLVIEGGTIAVDAGGDGLTSTNDEDATLGYVNIAGGDVSIAAVDDGVTGVSEVLVSAGTLTIDAVDDGIHADVSATIAGGTVTITAGDDALHADQTLDVAGGTIDVLASYEGLESAVLTISGGDTSVVSSDDGVNGAGGDANSLTISGGTLYVDGQGDGVDINGSITMSGGTVVVIGPTMEGNAPIDYDGSFQISGGFLLATGSSGMAQSPEATSAQSFVAATFATVEGGTTVHVESADGTDIVTFTPSRAFESIVVSSDAITAGGEYTVSVGGTASNADEHGLSDASDWSGGQELTTAIAGAALAGGFGPGGGGPGGGQGGGGGRP